MTETTLTTSGFLFRGKPVRRVHVMVKPTGARCNLDCTYCYYLSKEQLLGKPDNRASAMNCWKSSSASISPATTTKR